MTWWHDNYVNAEPACRLHYRIIVIDLFDTLKNNKATRYIRCFVINYNQIESKLDWIGFWVIKIYTDKKAKYYKKIYRQLMTIFKFLLNEENLIA